MSRLVTIVLGGLVLVACFQEPLPDLSNLPDAPADYPMNHYRSLSADGATVYEVNPKTSQVRVYVDKTGSMARAGHRHVLSSSTIGGFVAMDSDNRWQADLYLPVESFIVDEPALRAAAGEGYESDVDEDDRAGTRANMLSDKVLDVSRFPFLEVRVEPVILEQGTENVPFQTSIKGVTKDSDATVAWDPGSRTLSGSTTIVQTQFDMEPFSILGGAVGVGDALDVQFELTFDPASTP